MSRYFDQEQYEAGYKAKSHLRGEREAVCGSYGFLNTMPEPQKLTRIIPHRRHLLLLTMTTLRWALGRGTIG
jgi:hypothetical protein